MTQSSTTATLNQPINWPALDMYGIYIMMRSFSNEYGFYHDENDLNDKQVMTLLVLDTKRVIQPQYLKITQLHPLYIPSDASLPALYVFYQTEQGLNTDYEFSPNKLLKYLRIADSVPFKTTTKRQEIQLFKQKLLPIRTFVKNRLESSVLLAFNHRGEAVYQSTFGRFYQACDNDKLQRHAATDANADFLYAINARLNKTNKINESALQLCAYAYLSYNPTLHSKQGFQRFCEIIFSSFKLPSLYKTHADIAGVIVENLNQPPLQFSNIPLEYVEAFHQAVLFEQFKLALAAIDEQAHPARLSYRLFRQLLSNNEHFANHYDFTQINYQRASLPMPMAYLLGHLLHADYEQVSSNPTKPALYSPSCLNGSLLLISILACDNLFLNEPDISYGQSLRGLNQLAHKPKVHISHDPFERLRGLLSDDKPAYSSAILPSGHALFNEVIPFVDATDNYHLNISTTRLDQQYAINCLTQRDPNGRTVLVGPVDDNRDAGRINDSSVAFLRFLQAYYQDVTVVDIAASMLASTGFNTPIRLYVIGQAKTKPYSLQELKQRCYHIDALLQLPVIQSYYQLFDLTGALLAIEKNKRNPLELAMQISQLTHLDATVPLNLAYDKQWLEQVLVNDTTQVALPTTSNLASQTATSGSTNKLVDLLKSNSKLTPTTEDATAKKADGETDPPIPELTPPHEHATHKPVVADDELTKQPDTPVSTDSDKSEGDDNNTDNPVQTTDATTKKGTKKSTRGGTSRKKAVATTDEAVSEDTPSDKGDKVDSDDTSENTPSDNTVSDAITNGDKSSDETANDDDKAALVADASLISATDNADETDAADKTRDDKAQSDTPNEQPAQAQDGFEDDNTDELVISAELNDESDRAAQDKLAHLVEIDEDEFTKPDLKELTGDDDFLQSVDDDELSLDDIDFSGLLD